MRRTLVVLTGLALVAGCTPRPAARRTDAVGAPAVGVATEGEPDRSTLTAERLQQRASDRALENARQTLTIDGTLASATPHALTITPTRGRAVTLELAPLSSIGRDGRPLAPGGLVKGARVHATYVAEGGRNIAANVDVLAVPAERPEARKVSRRHHR